ncbi:uncharacterized protein METZ01_LOCUS221246, partial [marine metagenome]
MPGPILGGQVTGHKKAPVAKIGFAGKGFGKLRGEI